MKVISIEEQDNKFVAVYNEGSDVLEFTRSIPNTLETTRSLTSSPVFCMYNEEMEKIYSGDMSNISMVKLDEYLGTIGLTITPIINREGNKIDGICK